jgi:DNA-binding protein Alba
MRMAEKDDDLAFVGRKLAVNHVLAPLALFQARARAICFTALRAFERAVDSVDILSCRFLSNSRLKDFGTGVEQIAQRRGRNSI